MLPLLLVISAAAALWTLPLDSNCHVWPNRRGDRALIACTSERGLQLAVLASDGTKVEVQRIDRDIAEMGVASGPAEWSPTGKQVALEIGLDKEPGVLLIDVSDVPSAVFVDRGLAAASVSGADHSGIRLETG